MRSPTPAPHIRKPQHRELRNVRARQRKLNFLAILFLLRAGVQFFDAVLERHFCDAIIVARADGHRDAAQVLFEDVKFVRAALRCGKPMNATFGAWSLTMIRSYVCP